MDKVELTRELIEAFSTVNKADLFSKFRITLKGEDLFICILAQIGGVSTPGKISEFVDYSPARLSAIIKNLEGKGLIEKKQDVLDKRCTIIEITEKGSAYERKIEEELVGNSLFIVEKLGEKDTAEFLRIIKRLVTITNEELDNF